MPDRLIVTSAKTFFHYECNQNGIALQFVPIGVTNMAQLNVQFSVAVHVMAALGTRRGEPVRTTELAGSVNADPSFVRRVVSKLSKAGLIITVRGKNGSCTLSRAPSAITLLDIYKASEAPPASSVHGYPEVEACLVSRNIKGCLNKILDDAQNSFEKDLAGQRLSNLVAAIKKRT